MPRDWAFNMGPRREIGCNKTAAANMTKVTVRIVSELRGWWAVTVSNCRPPGCKPGALPAELTARISISTAFFATICIPPRHWGNTWGNILQISLPQSRPLPLVNSTPAMSLLYEMKSSPSAPTGIDVLPTGISTELASVTAINVLPTGVSMELADATAVGNVLTAGVSNGATGGRR